MATIYKINRQEVTEEEFHQLALKAAEKRGGGMGVPGTRSKSAWPFESDAMGVHPAQVAEAEAYAARCGCPTHYNPVTGNPEVQNPEHRNALMKINGLADRDAGYGDYAGR